MRKEKILEILENAKDGNGDVPMRLVRTAFDKLSEPCEDTISRQAAIDAAKHAWAKGLEPSQYIEIIPPAQPEPQWILCSERLPSKYGNYLVAVKSWDETASIIYYDVDHYGPDWLHDERRRKVVAWMPLPKPYTK